MSGSAPDRNHVAPNANVFALFESAAEARPKGAFLMRGGDVLMTYGAMLAKTARAAAWLQAAGIRPGDRAVVQMNKSPAAVIVYLACLGAGVVFIPLNTAYGETEIAYSR